MFRGKRATIAVIALVLGFFIYDMSEDLADGEYGVSFAIEVIIFTLASILLLHESYALYQLRRKYRAERDRNARLSRSLRTYIEERFHSWGLSNSEEEIAWLLLHGYAFSEIAEVRNTKEKTVRQQASTLYSKAEVGNRAEFVAIFLEELLAKTHPMPVNATPSNDERAVNPKDRAL